MIEMRDVSVAFGNTLALDSVNLTLAEGITGLFGQNGSGKSTLLRVITGLLRPRTGSVLVDGAELDVKDEDFRRSVGFAGHGAGLYADLTVRENLELFGRLYGVAGREIDDIVDQLALQESIGKRVATLSAGTKRRVSVARALVHRPRFLFLDEPYANLDTDSSDLVSAAIQQRRTDGGVAVIASHGAKRVKAYATAGVVLDRGRVATHGVYREKFERA